MTVPVAPMRDAFRTPAGRAWLVGAIVAVLGIAGSMLVAREQAASADEVEKVRVAQAVNSMTDALERRIDACRTIWPVPVRLTPANTAWLARTAAGNGCLAGAR